MITCPLCYCALCFNDTNPNLPWCDHRACALHAIALPVTAWEALNGSKSKPTVQSKRCPADASGLIDHTGLGLASEVFGVRFRVRCDCGIAGRWSDSTNAAVEAWNDFINYAARPADDEAQWRRLLGRLAALPGSAPDLVSVSVSHIRTLMKA
jgi:hypothetical protein